MFKPLFFTAMFSLITAFAQLGAKAETSGSDSHAAKPCPDGASGDRMNKKCVGAPDA